MAPVGQEPAPVKCSEALDPGLVSEGGASDTELANGENVSVGRRWVEALKSHQIFYNKFRKQ